MDELTIGDKIFISSKRAAAITGYAKDYVGQLCREGHVEARMVGRSWYVLESSIRAHRFGQPVQSQIAGAEGQAAEKGIDADDRGEADHSASNGARDTTLTETWEAPKYAAEEAPSMPELMPEPTPEPVILDAREAPQSLDISEDRESLSEMQAAWKEWFETKQEPTPTPTDDSEVEVSDVSEDRFEEAEEGAEDIEEPVSEAVEEPVPVAVHRIPEPRPVVYIEIPSKPVVQAPARDGRGHETGVIIREKRVRRRSSGPTNLVYSALMVAVAGIVIAIGFIGSGFADTYLGYNPIIEYLGGASSISK